MSLSTSFERESHLSGEIGIWVFILYEMMIFSVLFCTFMFYQSEAQFAAGSGNSVGCKSVVPSP